MDEEKIMSEEAINELINSFEIVGSLTEYGRKNIKYHFQRLQKENEQLQNNWNELKKWLEEVIKEVDEARNSYEKYSLFEERLRSKYFAYNNTLMKMQELENKSCHTTLE